MMKDSIINFPTQFKFEPKIVFPSHRPHLRKYMGSTSSPLIVCGMGGSALSGDLMRVWDPSRNVSVWRDYGLPPIFSPAELKERLVIVSSYSGNTEEALHALSEARKRHCALAVITTGGKLLARARRFRLPHIVLPDTGIQPRMALGFGCKSILALMHEKSALREMSALAHLLHPAIYENSGLKLAQILQSKIPLIYASRRNGPLAYAWKVKLNETAKIPAFANVVPELNHNEMTGFDPVKESKSQIANGKVQSAKRERIKLQKLFHAIILDDQNDEASYQKRLSVLSQLYRAWGIGITRVPITQKKDNAFFGIFSSLLTADWTAYHLAKYYGVKSEEVPIVEEFKRRMQR